MSNPACDDLSPDEYRRVRDLFDEIVELPPEAQRSRLDGVETRLRDAVEALLRSADEAGPGFLKPPMEATRQGEPALWAPGTVIGGRFRILSHLGAGGMGEVYAADDLQLGEPVALKTLRQSLVVDPLAVARLRNEVRRARRVGHPNVCRVYEFFEFSEPTSTCFITMELLRGKTLQEALRSGKRYSAAEALPLLRQIADALQSCHDAGIVHRDLKPSNVFLADPDGTHAVVMDFGICGDYQSSDQSTVLIAGTPAYMAPEQFSGDRATPRTDIYALGVLAYELVTGQQLMGSASPHAAALGERPQLDHGALPVAWREQILRCVERHPERRFARPQDFVEALSGRPVPSRRALLIAAGTATVLTAVGGWELWRRFASTGMRIGVLPFELSGPGEAFVASGLSDYLQHHLQNQPEIAVIGRDTMARFQGKAKPLSEIAREVGASVLVRASVSELTGNVAVSVQIVKPADGSLVWARAYRRPKDELDRLARDIATDTVGALISRPTNMPLPATPSPAAYDTYLRARYHFNRRDPGDLEAAISLFEQSIQLDGKFAAAYSGLSDALCALADVGHIEVTTALERAHAAASTAVELAPNDGHAYASLGLVVSFREADWQASEGHFRRALVLSPRDPAIHQWFSALLLKLGRFDECLERARQAVQLDPLSLAANVNVANMALLAGRYTEAEKLFLHVQQLAPEYWFVHEALGETYARLGHREEALREVDLALKLGRTRGRALAWAANARAILGDRREALALLQELTSPVGKHMFQPFHVARAYAELGLADEAFAWLERGLARHDIGLQIVPIHRSFDRIRKDPRYAPLLARLPVPHA